MHRLSKNFTLAELLHSDTAERFPVLAAAQENPPADVVFRLQYLASNALQPCRDALAWPLTVTSGWRSPALNERIGGSRMSQHLVGEAADLNVAPGFLEYADLRLVGPRLEPVVTVRETVRSRLGRRLSAGVNANFYLFAWVCLNLDRLDVDQVIHEYGSPGRPAWVHLATSPGTGPKYGTSRITVVGRHTGGEYRDLSVDDALALGL
ncbi:D-Ala-D-Ala carboxypeptidase family metallohydrolase [Endothiovibrio diazotrophicus]